MFCFLERHVAVDPIQVLSDPQLSYQDVFYILYYQARKSMLLHVKTDPNIDQTYLQDQLQTFCSSHGKVVHFMPVKETVSHWMLFLCVKNVLYLVLVTMVMYTNLTFAVITSAVVHACVANCQSFKLLLYDKNLCSRFEIFLHVSSF